MTIFSLAIAYTGVVELMAVLPRADCLNNILHHQWLSGVGKGFELVIRRQFVCGIVFCVEEQI